MEEKVWIFLYIYYVIRVVYFYIVIDLIVEVFFRSFVRFIVRRGLLLKIVLDNGSVFKFVFR